MTTSVPPDASPARFTRMLACAAGLTLTPILGLGLLATGPLTRELRRIPAMRPSAAASLRASLAWCAWLLAETLVAMTLSAAWLAVSSLESSELASPEPLTIAALITVLFTPWACPEAAFIPFELVDGRPNAVQRAREIATAAPWEARLATATATGLIATPLWLGAAVSGRLLSVPVALGVGIAVASLATPTLGVLVAGWHARATRTVAHAQGPAAAYGDGRLPPKPLGWAAIGLSIALHAAATVARAFHPLPAEPAGECPSTESFHDLPTWIGEIGLRAVASRRGIALTRRDGGGPGPIDVPFTPDSIRLVTAESELDEPESDVTLVLCGPASRRGPDQMAVIRLRRTPLGIQRLGDGAFARIAFGAGGSTAVASFFAMLGWIFAILAALRSRWRLVSFGLIVAIPSAAILVGL